MLNLNEKLRITIINLIDLNLTLSLITNFMLILIWMKEESYTRLKLSLHKKLQRKINFTFPADKNDRYLVWPNLHILRGHSDYPWHKKYFTQNQH